MPNAGNEYDLVMGMTPVEPIGFIVGMAICILVGWLLTRKKKVK